ncbi:MAG: MltA domain-containing protein [Syntrophales bacterium]|nr:MltA domain-containing protein [Syntrophales bacterium]
MRRIFCLLFFFLIWSVFGCAPRMAYLPHPSGEEEKAVMVDDMDLRSLEEAIERSLRFFQTRGEQREYCFRDRCHRGREFIVALGNMKGILAKAGEPWSEKEKAITEIFDFIPVSDNLIVTGYFEPILEGSLTKDERFRYPIYRPPEDIVIVRLGKFNRKYGNDVLVGRLAKNEVVPFFSRKEIDVDKVLARRGLEIAWVDEPVELFFLHLQGSGKIRLRDGSFINVSYAQRNGRPYRSIATYMVEKGYVKSTETSHRHIKAFLKANPHLRDEILSYNESYIFFREVEEGPVGALGVTLVSGRSVALDGDVYPPGAPLILKSRRPVRFEEDRPTMWESFTRLVFHHDGGTAIKGPHRLDLFCGTGPQKELEAGSLKEPGKLILLLPKK